MEDKVDKTIKKQSYGFKKGDKNINRNGRPKGSVSLLTDIKKELKRMAEKDPEEYKKLIRFYIDNEKTRDLLIKMIDGMPKQKTEVTGADGGSLAIALEKKIEINDVLDNFDDNSED